MEDILNLIKSSIFRKILTEDYDDILKRYKEPWRFYHTENHILSLYKNFEKGGVVVGKDYVKMILLTVFHDVIYYPWKDDNEYQSAQYFKRISKYIKPEYEDIVEWVYNGIIATKEHKKSGDELLDLFMSWDMGITKSNNPYDLMEWERQISKEYSIAPTSLYKAGRIDFLKSLNNNHSNRIIEYLENEYRPKVGFYAGSFDPFHKGHLSIVQQSQKVYDKVVILIGQNADKPLLTEKEIEKRKKAIFSHCPGIEIQYFKGFITTYLEERSKDEEIFLVRGIRNTMDWMIESNYLQYCRELMPSIEVQYFTCPKNIEHVSSSGIRSMEKEVEGSGNIYIPEVIYEA